MVLYSVNHGAFTKALPHEKQILCHVLTTQLAAQLGSLHSVFVVSCLYFMKFMLSNSNCSIVSLDYVAELTGLSIS